MSEETTHLIHTFFDDDGIAVAETLFSPTSNTTRAQCVAPPATTVPVVFVPGVMGSNLKAKKDIKDPIANKKIFKAGDPVWNVSGMLTAANPFDLFKTNDNWWGKDARFRQLVMDKDLLCVDNGGRIAQGQTSHLGQGGAYRVESTGRTPQAGINIEEAGKRGWGCPGWHFYGGFLDWLQYQLNQGRLVDGKPDAILERIAKLVDNPPDDVKACVAPLTKEQTRKTLDIHFPVYAVGYNWLQSNMQSGADLMQGTGKGDGHVLGINEIIEREDGKPGRVCDKVIVITHSMGGMVARAAALKQGGEDKMLGIIHGVQPIDGAAKFYKVLAAGFGGLAGSALGPTARESTPEIAYNPGLLELAPNKRYNGGQPWLFVKDQQGNTMKLPRNGDPYEEIYMDTDNVWRAVNPEWLDPANQIRNPIVAYKETVKAARNYHDPEYGGIAAQLHPQTFAHWGDDSDYKSYGTVTWRTHRPLPLSQTPHQGWTLYDSYPATRDGERRYIERGDGAVSLISIDPPAVPGDGTVPADASAAQIADYPGCQMACAMKSFSHQGDYNNENVRDVALDAIVRLVEPVEING